MTITRRALRLCHLLTVCALALALAPFVSLPTARAAGATWTVGTTKDTTTPAASHCAGTVCPTLRDALVAAASGDTISLAGLSGTIITTSPLTVRTSLSITGPLTNTLVLSGSHDHTVVVVNSGVTAAISGLTVSFGSGLTPNLDGTFGGGGINNRGNLTLTNMVISENQTEQNDNYEIAGGGIANSGIGTNGTLNLIDSTVISNTSATGEGAGIYSSEGAVYISKSTIAANVGGQVNATSGGGVEMVGGLLTVTDSTIVGNSAPNIGAGILVDSGALRLVDSTVARNKGVYSAGVGIAVLLSNSTVTAVNSVIAGNTWASGVGDCAYFAGAPVLTDLGGNLDSDGSCGLSAAKYSISLATTPGIASAADNGGPTQTMALLAGSQAIKLGVASGCTAGGGVDQRGVPRTATSCDSGAMEVTLPAVSMAVTSSAKTFQQIPGTGLISPSLILTSTVTLTNSAVLSVPSGTVQFKMDGLARGAPVTLVNGSATSAKISTLAVGTHTVTAVYTGAPIFPSVSGTVSLVVRSGV